MSLNIISVMEKEKCVKKMKEMQTYLPFLDYMIDKIKRKTDILPLECHLSKFQNIRSVISEKNGRYNLQRLYHIEDILLKLISKLNYKETDLKVKKELSGLNHDLIEIIDKSDDTEPFDNESSVAGSCSADIHVLYNSNLENSSSKNTGNSSNKITDNSSNKIIDNSSNKIIDNSSNKNIDNSSNKNIDDSKTKNIVNSSNKNIDMILNTIHVSDSELSRQNFTESQENIIGHCNAGEKNSQVDVHLQNINLRVNNVEESTSSSKKVQSERKVGSSTNSGTSEKLISDQQKLLSSVSKTSSLDEKIEEEQKNSNVKYGSDSKKSKEKENCKYSNDQCLISDLSDISDDEEIISCKNKNANNEKNTCEENVSTILNYSVDFSKCDRDTINELASNLNEIMASDLSDSVNLLTIKKKLREKLSADIAKVHKVPGKSVGGSLRSLKHAVSPLEEIESFQFKNSRDSHQQSEKSDSKEKDDHWKPIEKKRTKLVKNNVDGKKNKLKKKASKKLYKIKRKSRPRERKKNKYVCNTEVEQKKIQVNKNFTFNKKKRINEKNNSQKNMEKKNTFDIDQVDFNELVDIVKENEYSFPNLSKLKPSELRKITKSSLSAESSSFDSKTLMQQTNIPGDNNLNSKKVDDSNPCKKTGKEKIAKSSVKDVSQSKTVELHNREKVSQSLPNDLDDDDDDDDEYARNLIEETTLSFRINAQPVQAQTVSIHVQPELLHAQPLPVHAQPLPVHAQPLPVHAQPLPVHAQPLPVHAQPLPVHAQSLPVHAQSLPVHAQSLTSHAQSQVVHAQSQLVHAQSQPVHAQSQQVHAQSQLVYAQSQSFYSQSQPIYAQSQLIYAQSQPVNAQSQPFHVQLQPVNSHISKFVTQFPSMSNQNNMGGPKIDGTILENKDPRLKRLSGTFENKKQVLSNVNNLSKSCHSSSYSLPLTQQKSPVEYQVSPMLSNVHLERSNCDFTFRNDANNKKTFPNVVGMNQRNNKLQTFNATSQTFNFQHRPCPAGQTIVNSQNHNWSQYPAYGMPEPKSYGEYKQLKRQELENMSRSATNYEERSKTVESTTVETQNENKNNKFHSVSNLSKFTDNTIRKDALKVPVNRKTGINENKTKKVQVAHTQTIKPCNEVPRKYSENNKEERTENSSNGKISIQDDELISPLEKLYENDPKPATGRGYGLQNFKIPKKCNTLPNKNKNFVFNNNYLQQKKYARENELRKTALSEMECENSGVNNSEVAEENWDAPEENWDAPVENWDTSEENWDAPEKQLGSDEENRKKNKENLEVIEVNCETNELNSKSSEKYKTHEENSRSNGENCERNEENYRNSFSNNFSRELNEKLNDSLKLLNHSVEDTMDVYIDKNNKNCTSKGTNENLNKTVNFTDIGKSNSGTGNKKVKNNDNNDSNNNNNNNDDDDDADNNNSNNENDEVNVVINSNNNDDSSNCKRNYDMYNDNKNNRSIRKNDFNSNFTVETYVSGTNPICHNKKLLINSTGNAINNQSDSNATSALSEDNNDTVNESKNICVSSFEANADSKNKNSEIGNPVKNEVTTGPEEKRNAEKSNKEIDSTNKSLITEEITQELIEALISKSFQSGEDEDEDELLLAKAKLFKELALKLNSKKLKTIQKIINSESDDESSSQSSVEEKRKKKNTKKSDGLKKKKSDDADLKPKLSTKKDNKKICKNRQFNSILQESNASCDAVTDSEKRVSETDCEIKSESNENLNQTESSNLKSKSVRQKPDIVEKTGKDDGKSKLLEQILKESPQKDYDLGNEDENSTMKGLERKIKSRVKAKAKTELDRLHEDIKSMFISSGVITASGHRMCRILRESSGSMNNLDSVKESTKTLEEEKLKNDTINKKEDTTTYLRCRSRSDDRRKLRDRSKSRNPSEQNEGKINNDKLANTAVVEGSSKFNLPKIQPFVLLKKLNVDKLHSKYKIGDLPGSYFPIKSRNVARRGRSRRGGLSRFSKEREIQINKIRNIYLNRNKRKILNMKDKPKKRVYKSKKLVDIIQKLPLKMANIKHLEIASNEKKMDEKITDEIKIKSDVDNSNSGILSEENKKEDVKESSDQNMLDYAFDKSRTVYSCLLCPQVTKSITVHYRTEHPESEILISRLERLEAEKAINDSKLNNYDVSTLEQTSSLEIVKRRVKCKLSETISYYCRMCNYNNTGNVNQFFSHISTHTGEYRYKCPYEGCSVLMAYRENVKSHMFSKHTKRKNSNLQVLEQFLLPTESGNLFGYLCSKCNFVQVFKKHVEDHILKTHSAIGDAKIIKIDMSDKPLNKEVKIRKRGKRQKKKNDEEKEKQNEQVKRQNEQKNKYDDHKRDEQTEKTEQENVAMCKEMSENNEDKDCDNSGDAVRHSDNHEDGGHNENYKNNSLQIRKTRRSASDENSNKAKTRRKRPREEDASPNKNDSAMVPQNAKVSKVGNTADDENCETKKKMFNRVSLTNPIKINDFNDTDRFMQKKADKDLKDSGSEVGAKALKTLKKEQNAGANSELIISLNVAEDTNISHKWKVGFLETVMFINEMMLYKCYIKVCKYSTSVFAEFKDHLKMNHGTEHWNEECESCDITERSSMSDVRSTPTIADALDHLQNHIKLSLTRILTKNISFEQAERTVNENNFTTENETDNILEPSEDLLKELKKEMIDIEQNPYPSKPLLRVRSLMGDRLSRPKDLSDKEFCETQLSLVSDASLKKEGTNDRNNEEPRLFKIENVRSLNPHTDTPVPVPENALKSQELLSTFPPNAKVISGKPILIRSCPSPKIAIRSENNAIPISASQAKQAVEVGHLKVVSSPVNNDIASLNQLLSASPIRIISPATFTSQAVIVPTFTTTPHLVSISQPIEPVYTTTISGNQKLVLKTVAKKGMLGEDQGVKGTVQQPLEMVNEDEKNLKAKKTISISPKAISSSSSKTIVSSFGETVTETNSPKKRKHCFTFRSKNIKDAVIYQEMLQKRKLCHLYKCMAVECSFTCNNHNIFTQHIGLHEAQQRIKGKKKPTNNVKKVFNWQQCAYCCEVFLQSGSALSNHILLQHGHCVFQCGYCFYRAMSKMYVDLHQNTIHEKILKEKKKLIYKCKPATEVEMSLNLEKHVKPTNVKPYFCGHCDSKFLIIKHFVNHLTTKHQSVTAYACHICKNLCFKVDRLISHYKLHSYSMYQCTYCLHGAETKKEMLFHLCNFHFSQPPLICARAVKNSKKLNITVDDLKMLVYDREPNEPDDSLEEVESDMDVETKDEVLIATSFTSKNYEQEINLEDSGSNISISNETAGDESSKPLPPLRMLPNTQFTNEVKSGDKNSDTISPDMRTVINDNNENESDASLPIGQLSLEILPLQIQSLEESTNIRKESSLTPNLAEESLNKSGTENSDVINSNILVDEQTKSIVDATKQQKIKTSEQKQKVNWGMHKLPPTVPVSRSSIKNVYKAKKLKSVKNPEEVKEEAKGAAAPILFKHLSASHDEKPSNVPAQSVIVTLPVINNSINSLWETDNSNILIPSKNVIKLNSQENESLSTVNDIVGQTSVLSEVPLSTDTSKPVLTDSRKETVLPKISHVRSLSKEKCWRDVRQDEVKNNPVLQPPIIRIEDFITKEEKELLNQESDILIKDSKTVPVDSDLRKKNSFRNESDGTTINHKESNRSPEIIFLDADEEAKLKENELIELLDSEDEGEQTQKTNVILNENNFRIRKEMDELRNEMRNETDCLLDDSSQTEQCEPTEQNKAAAKADEINVEERNESTKENGEDGKESFSTSELENDVPAMAKSLESETVDAFRKENDEPSLTEASSTKPHLQGESSDSPNNAVSNKEDDNTSESCIESTSVSKTNTTETSTTKIKQRKKIKNSELVGKDLYLCGFGKCTFAAEKDKDLKDHLIVCDFSGESSFLNCPHCFKQFKNNFCYVEHLRLHGEKKYGCGLCNFISALEISVSKHLKLKHKCSQIKSFPDDSGKPGYFVLYPKNYKKGKQGEEIVMYSPGDEDKLPLQAIYQVNVKCAKCPYFTKVRSNMVRHLKIHIKSVEAEGSIVVPSTAPTNPVPCLESKEKMFDKMTNLAASSQLAQAREKAVLETLSPEEEAKLPHYVPEQMRHKCCASDCNYLTIDDNMLKHHIKALHNELNVYSCPHCKDTVQIEHRFVALDKIGQHLKHHDSKLYKCVYCMYYHYQKHKVEKHIFEKHPERRIHVYTVREPKTESASEEDSPSLPNEHATKVWKCGFCQNFESTVRSCVVDHLWKVHNTRSKYKCKFCEAKYSQYQALATHFTAKHVGQNVEFIQALEQVSRSKLDEDNQNKTSKEYFDTTPLWQRDAPRVRHIRGILIEEAEMKTKRTRKVCNEIENDLSPRRPDNIPPDSFYCPLCLDRKKVFHTKNVNTFLAHLYQELNYYQFACMLCGKMFVDKKEFDKHHTRFHPSKTQALKQTQEDGEIRFWIDKVIEKQQIQIRKKKGVIVKKKSLGECQRTKRKKIQAKTSGTTVKKVATGRHENTGLKRLNNTSEVKCEDEGTKKRRKNVKKPVNSQEESSNVDTVRKALDEFESDSGTKIYCCGNCLLEIKDEKSIIKHIKNDHNRASGEIKQIDEGKKLYQCKVCAEKLNEIEQLQQHAGLCHPNLPLQFEIRQVFTYDYVFNVKTDCSQCKKIPCECTEMNIIVDNAKDGSYQCPRCPTICSSYIECIEHFNEHYPRYVCGICNLRFSSEENIKKHKTDSNHLCPNIMSIPPDSMLEVYKSGITVKQNGKWVPLKPRKRSSDWEDKSEIKKFKTEMCQKSDLVTERQDIFDCDVRNDVNNEDCNKGSAVLPKAAEST